MKKARRTVSDNGDFMDSAVLAAESWPLLLGLPLIAGIVSLAIVAMTPTQYLARTAIPLIERAQALIDSREFSKQFAASGLASEDFALVAEFDSATRSTVITTTTTNADDARMAVENTIATLRILAPIQSSSLAREAELLSAQIGRLEAFTTSLEASAQAPRSPETSTLAITDAVVALTDAIRTKQDRLGALQDQLEIAEQIAAMPPEIDVAPVAKDWRVVLAAILAGATLSAALVYARIRLMQASKIPGFEEKRARIVRALTLNLLGGRTENGPKSR